VKRHIPFAALRLLRQLRHVPGPSGTIAIGGSRELVTLLATELRAGGGDAAAVTENRTDPDAVALIWIGAPNIETLRAASQAQLAIVGLTEGESLPYVLDTNIVRVAPGRGLPVEEVAKALARALGPRGAAVAARLPVLRPAVTSALARRTTMRAGVIGATRPTQSSDFPALTLNQSLLVVRTALASGRKANPEALLPELAGVALVGLAARTAGRRLEVLPFGSVLRGVIAAGGTAAVGAVMRRRFGVR
jgi:uncharacterized protein (DUF697 family)